jgi:tetratricopeptide (TPR) repeat protein
MHGAAPAAPSVGSEAAHGLPSSAEAARGLPPSAAAGPTRPLWTRLYDHALGMSLNVQESLDQARWSAQRALDLIESGQGGPADANARGMLLVVLARCAGRQGRLEEALALAERAEGLVGKHAAIERVRADAYAQVWRWREAADALTTVTELGPFDTASFRELAKARLSAKDPAAALAAAQGGLRLQPRDEGLLRVQALALEATGSPDAAAAREAFLFYRDADEATISRLNCDRRIATCARDRMPVVTLQLTGAKLVTASR